LRLILPEIGIGACWAGPAARVQDQINVTRDLLEPLRPVIDRPVGVPVAYEVARALNAPLEHQVFQLGAQPRSSTRQS
jgi:hypothetical protein